MPSKKFILKEGDDQGLEIKWKQKFKNIIIYHGVKKLGTINGKTELKNGKDFNLGNGSKINIKLIKYLGFMPEWEILLDGKILSGSPTDPVFQLDQIFWLVVVIGVLNVLLGILGSLGIDVLVKLQVGWGSIIYGLLLFVLGFGLKRKCMMCLVMIVILWTLELVYWFYLMVSTGDVSIGGVIIKIVILFFMLRGFSALKRSKKKECHCEC